MLFYPSFCWTKEEIEQKDMLNILSKESSAGEREKKHHN